MLIKDGFWQLGYTPNNLRLLIEQTRLSQSEFAKKYGYSLSTLQNWISPLDSKRHRDMPLNDWFILVDKILGIDYIND